MLESQPTTETMNPPQVRKRLDEILEAVRRRERRVIVEKDGKPVAAIISFRDLEWLNRYEEQRDKDIAALEAISRAFEDVPLEELERQVELALQDVREENRKRRSQTS